MKQARSLLVASLLLLSFQCSEDAPAPEEGLPPADSLAGLVATSCADSVKTQGDPLFATNATGDLCGYRPAVPPPANQLLMLADQLSARVRMFSEVNRYALVVSVDGTYDCRLIFFTCTDLGKYVDQMVTFSGEVSPYNGSELVVPVGTERYSLSELVLN